MIRGAIVLIRKYYKQQDYKKALKIYLNIIKMYGEVRGIYDIRNYTDIQISDMELTFEHTETLWLRSRRAGKTRDMTVLAIFYTIIGNTVNWFSVTEDQLEAVRTWFELNPFTDTVTNDKVNILDCKNEINFGILSAGQVVSKGANTLFFDELRSCPKKDNKYRYYLSARGQLAAASNFKIVSGTTTETGSTEHEQYLNLLSTDPNAISLHPYQDFPHLSEEFIQHEQDQHQEDPWYVDQEYRCKHVLRGGAVFDNITDCELKDIKDLILTHVGVDINYQEMAVGLHITKDYKNCYVLFEKQYSWTKDITCYDELRSPSIMYKGRKINIHPKATIEIENDGYNEKECMVVCSRISGIPVSWASTNKDREVGERQAIGRKFEHIYICRANTPNIYDDLTTMVYQKLKAIYLKDSQHQCHWSDAFLHALNLKDTRMVLSSKLNQDSSGFCKNPFAVKTPMF
jgi:hypothetical protein